VAAAAGASGGVGVQWRVSDGDCVRAWWRAGDDSGSGGGRRRQGQALCACMCG
jgi:hypothetical protein